MEAASAPRQTVGEMIQSYRSYLWSSPPSSQLGTLVLVLIAIGSLIPFADLVAAPLLLYAGKQLRAQQGLDRTTRLIGQVAAGTGLVMLALALWSLLSLAELFVPQTIG
jgi:hypothetical protein